MKGTKSLENNYEVIVVGNSQEWFLNDPIYGLIHFPKDGIAYKLINSIELQRLRNIKQLGFVDLVYPGASNSRFQHSIGVAWLTKLAMDNLIDNIEDPKEYSEFTGGLFRWLESNSNDILYLKAVEHQKVRLKNTLIAAALLHDVGHGPFSHTLEHFWLRIGHEELSKFILTIPPPDSGDKDRRAYNILSEADKSKDWKMLLIYFYNLLEILKDNFSSPDKPESNLFNQEEFKYIKDIDNSIIQQFTKTNNIKIDAKIEFCIAKAQTLLSNELLMRIINDTSEFIIRDDISLVKEAISKISTIPVEQIPGKLKSVKDQLLNCLRYIDYRIFMCSNLFDDSLTLIPMIINGDTENANSNLSGKPSFICAVSNLVHSELDFDRIDYLMRDEYYSGLNVRVDYEFILRHQKILMIDHINVYNICYDERAQVAIDSFLATRFHHYPLIAFNNTNKASETIIQRIIYLFYLLKNVFCKSTDPNISLILEMMKDSVIDTVIISKYLTFVDDTIVSAIRRVAYDKDYFNKLQKRIRREYKKDDRTKLNKYLAEIRILSKKLIERELLKTMPKDIVKFTDVINHIDKLDGITVKDRESQYSAMSKFDETTKNIKDDLKIPENGICLLHYQKRHKFYKNDTICKEQLKVINECLQEYGKLDKKLTEKETKTFIERYLKTDNLNYDDILKHARSITTVQVPNKTQYIENLKNIQREYVKYIREQIWIQKTKTSTRSEPEIVNIRELDKTFANSVQGIDSSSSIECFIDRETKRMLLNDDH